MTRGAGFAREQDRIVSERRSRGGGQAITGVFFGCRIVVLMAMNFFAVIFVAVCFGFVFVFLHAEFSVVFGGFVSSVGFGSEVSGVCVFVSGVGFIGEMCGMGVFKVGTLFVV